MKPHVKNSTLVSIGLSTALSLIAASAYADESSTPEESGPATSFSVALKQDIFFGFHGITQVGINLSEGFDATLYGILWTRPAFGGGGSGGNLWTEWGGGVSFDLLDGALAINPQFGFLNGTLLSGSSRGLTFEGIVPNLTVTYGDGLLEGQIYAGMYIGLRNLNDSANNDYLHYWANFGVAALSWLSVGVHWEHLWQTRGAGADTADVYQWLGPYVEARGGPGFIRFAGGVDLTPDDLSDFYQLTTGLSL